MNLPQNKKPRVVIVGGGFGGIALAKKLKHKPYQVVLLDKRNYHTFQPLLYQVSTSGLEPDSIAYPLRKIIKKAENVHYRMAEVAHINPKKKCVTTDIGEVVYDFLVLATGTKTNFFGNESIEDHAVWMKTVPQALNIRSLILENLERANREADPKLRKKYLTFAVAGAGPTGVELCGAIAELKNHVLGKDYPEMDLNQMSIHLFEGMDRVLPPMSPQASKKALHFLEELGVTIHLETFVESYDGDTVTLKGGEKLETEAFIWSAGVTGAQIDGLKDALHEKTNRYVVNEYSRVQGHENIFAIGDIALMETDEYPKGHPQVAQPAIQQGKHLAKNLMRLHKGKSMEPFEYVDKGTMATVGRNRAVVDMGKLHFGGFFAWFIWMFIHLWFLVGFRNRVVTFFNWTYNYINFDKAARLIIRPFRSNKQVALED